MGYEAFYGCSNLTSVTIGSGVFLLSNNVGVKNYDSDAFKGCPNITSISVSAENTVYDSRNNCNAIIRKSDNTLVVGCKGTVIPDSVVSIGERSFYGSKITSIEIPNSVTSIEKGAFSQCTSLTSLVIGSNVTRIEYEAFYHCAITSVTIPDPVNTIGDRAFIDCSNLTSVIIGSGVTSIGHSAFSYCPNLETITINLQVAPSYQFGTNSSTAGYNKRTSGTNRLYVPANATGYESGDWVAYLCNSNYGGFTLSKTL